MKSLIHQSSNRWVVYGTTLFVAYLATSTAEATKVERRRVSSTEKTSIKSAAPTVGPATLIGGNVHVNDPNADDPTTGLHTQSETTIAFNPNSGTICIAFNDYPGLATQSAIGFASSNDDGATFQDRGQIVPQPQLPNPPLGAFSDPTMIWRRFDGKFYLVAALGFAEGIGIWASNDDCKTFTPVSTISAPPSDADKPMLAFDNDPSSSHYGRAYVSWKDVSQRVTFSYSDDATTWSTPMDLSANGPTSNGSWPVVLPGGALYVFWSQLNGSTFDIKYVSSVTGGSSFGATATVVSAGITPYNVTVNPDPTNPMLNGGIRYNPFSQVAVGSDGCMHLVYPLGPNTSHTGDCSDVYYQRSCNGTTWTSPLKINDDGTATDQWSPAVSVGAGGIVSIGFYDRRSSANNMNFEYYNRVSLNNGTSFQTSTRISSFVSPLHVDGGGYHGDYDMQVQRPGAQYIVWSDDHDVTAGANSPDVFFQKACPQTGCTIAPAQPRQISPLSTAKVTSHRPVFKVALGAGSNGVRVDVCRDRACTNIVTTLRATGSSVTPTADLPTGMLYWRAFGRSGTTDGLAPSATWQFRVTGENAGIKSSWGAEPDFNGDGRPDVAVSAQAAGAGKVYVYNANGTAAGIPASPSRVLLAPTGSTTFGSWLANAGDVNGDGFTDLVVAAVKSPSITGVMYVYYGSPSGIASHPGAMISAPNTPSSAFSRPQAAGDVNGDGYADLLVTDPGFIGNNNTFGRAYVYFGGPSGLALTPSQTFDPPRASAYIYFGFYDGPAGDVNGDGFGDVVIASYAPTTESVTFLYLGGASGLRTPTALSSTAGIVVGSQGIGFGDVNGDGLSDITVAVTPTGGVPEPCLYAGATGSPGVNPTPLVYGFALGNLHQSDLDNDGFDDLIIGLPASATDPGSVWAFAGSIFGYALLPSGIVTGPDGNNSGYAGTVGVIGDVDGDGLPDVGVSAVNAANQAGKFYLYSAGNIIRTLTGTDGQQSKFGLVMAPID